MNEEMSEISVGRIVHFVIWDGYKEKCRPSICVENWPDQGRPGYVNLQVFTDGSNDGDLGRGGIAWETSVLPNHAVKAVRTWHWPRLCSRLHVPAAPFIKVDKNPVTGLEEYTKFHHNHANSVVDTHNCYACALKQGVGTIS